jgi:hypothetical protein
MKKILFFAAALFALFSASCSSNGNEPPDSSNSQVNVQSNTGCFETAGQIIDRDTKKPYTGNGKVYLVEEREKHTGKLILTDETMLLVGTVDNGKITFNCPSSVDSRFLTKSDKAPPKGMTIEPLNVEGWFYSSPFRLMDNSNKYIGDLWYAKIDDTESHLISIMYFSKDVKINGIENDGEGGITNFKINAKKGWNRYYRIIDESDSGTITTDLSKVPDGLEWICSLH